MIHFRVKGNQYLHSPILIPFRGRFHSHFLFRGRIHSQIHLNLNLQIEFEKYLKNSWRYLPGLEFLSQRIRTIAAA